MEKEKVIRFNVRKLKEPNIRKRITSYVNGQTDGSEIELILQGMMVSAPEGDNSKNGLKCKWCDAELEQPKTKKATKKKTTSKKDKG